jgi:hypothetical protein
MTEPSPSTHNKPMSESTTEESGPPVTTEPRPVRPPIILTPPPLSQAQVEKIIKAVEAVEEAVEALGSLYGDYCKWVLSKVKPIIIPPIGPTIPPP